MQIVTANSGQEVELTWHAWNSYTLYFYTDSDSSGEVELYWFKKRDFLHMYVQQMYLLF